MIRTKHNGFYFFIYKTINHINGKIYVGQRKTKNLNDGYLGSGTHITRSIKHYGKENFYREILEFCKDKDQLNEKEIYWIAKLDSYNFKVGYNLTKGGENRLEHHTKEHKQHFKEAYLRRPLETCLYCGYQSRNGSSSKKLHGENCKMKPGNENKKYRSEQTIQTFKETINTKPLLTCSYCGYIGKSIKRDHNENCKHNPNYISKEYVCSYCGYIGKNNSLMRQWHFDNCKQNPNYIFKETPHKIVTCLYCGKIGDTRGMWRWHFDNCKYKFVIQQE